MIEALGIEVTNTKGNHRKFYRVFVVGIVEIRQWGRIGANGQHTRTAHPTTIAAETSARRKINEKIIDRGYEDMIVHRFSAQNPVELRDLRARWAQFVAKYPLGEIDLWDEDEPDPRYQQVLWEVSA